MANRHKKIADAFAELNSTLNEKRDNYLEKISSTINKATKKSDDKKLWEESYDKIVDLMYAALTDTYLETVTTLRNVYVNISDETLDIEDFIYKDDDITLPQRVKKYWDEAASLLTNPETDLQEIYGIEINNEIKEILSEFNINKDNSLTFNEFLYIIYKIF